MSDKRLDEEEYEAKTRSLRRVVEMPGIFSLYMSITKLQAKQAVRRASRRLGINTPKLLDMAALEPPDTEVVKRAAQLCRDLSDDQIFNHCMRAYYFATAIFSHEGFPAGFDREVAFVAVAFHDFGLTDAGRSDKKKLEEESFEVRGALKCHRACLEQFHYGEEKAEMLYEAIRIHTTMGRAEQGKNIYGKFVNYGSVCDVIGYHVEDIHKKTKKTVVEKYPRLDWKNYIIERFDEEMEISVCPMIKFLKDYMFLDMFIRQAPFRE